MRGRDITRYGYEFNDLWLINTHNGIKEKNIAPIDINNYPAIKAHLDKFWEKLSTRADKGDTPYNLRNCVYTDDFSKQKIVWGNLCLSSQFAWVENDFFINAPSTMITNGSKYLLAMLNSRVIDWYIKKLGVTRNGGYFEYKPMFIEATPIPMPSQDIIDDLEQKVDRIMSIRKDGGNSTNIEDEIDDIVANMFNLSSEEIDYLFTNSSTNCISSSESE